MIGDHISIKLRKWDTVAITEGAFVFLSLKHIIKTVKLILYIILHPKNYNRIIDL